MHKILKQRWLAVILLAIFLPSVATPTVQAISRAGLEAILKQSPFVGEDAGGTGATCAVTTPTTDNPNGDAPGKTAEQITLNGSDNEEKTYNYFAGSSVGLNSVQTSALMGNFAIESGFDPRANNNGHHLGLAQWDAVDRYGDLKRFAGNLDPNDLAVQLQFVWLELNGQPPANDYSDELKGLRQYTTEDQLATATTYIQDNYEGAPGQATQERIEQAKRIFAKYGKTTVTDSGTTIGATTGSNAPCGSVGAVDCNNTSNATGDLSQLRQNVVCLAEAELALWDSGQMKPGTDFFKYQSGLNTNNEWCAWFASWIYNEAGYPLTTGEAGRVSLVSDIRTIGQTSPKFSYYEKGSYVPKPGDLAIYKNDRSHVNIVVSVNLNAGTMTTIGGNEGGTEGILGDGTDSYVKKQTNVNYRSESTLSGFTVPKE